jgi:hypothetical protein
MVMKRMSVAAAAVLAFAVSGFAWAGDLSVGASADKRHLAVGESLTLTITVQGGGKVDEPDLGKLDGFELVNSYSSRNFTLVNMKASVSLNLQYVLVALREGDYTLGPFTVRADENVFETAPIRVTVSKGTQAVPKPEGQAEEDTDLVRAIASVDKRRAYVGDQITYTLRFAYRVRGLDDTQYLPPDHTGFWYEDLGETGPTIETIDGVKYYVITKRIAFFPISSGRYTVGEAGIRYVIDGLDPFLRDPFQVFHRDPFSGFRRKQGVAMSKPIEIEVMPLPAQGRPSDFSGAVGRFSLTASASRQEVTAGESLTLSFRIKGTGNIKSIREIPQPEIEGFRVFAPKARESVLPEGTRIAGEKIFELVLVPQIPGDYIIDGFSFTYFDPGKGAYVTSRAEPVEITVLEGDELIAGSPPVDGAIPRITRKDIRHIKRESVEKDGLSMSVKGVSGVVLRYGPLVAVLAGVLISVQRRRMAVTGRGNVRKAFREFSRDLKAVVLWRSRVSYPERSRSTSLREPAVSNRLLIWIS